MSYTPVIGHTVRVADKASFYNGREAVVSAITVIEGILIYRVQVGNVSFSLKRSNLRELTYGEAR